MSGGLGRASALDDDRLWVGLMAITIRDKVEGERKIPLTPYVWSLLNAPPRRNGWLFSGGRALLMTADNIRRRQRNRAASGVESPAVEVLPASKSGRLVEPSIAHRQACAAANIEGLPFTACAAVLPA